MGLKRIGSLWQIDQERKDSAEEYNDCAIELIDCFEDDRVTRSRHIWVGGHERRRRRRSRDQASTVLV